MSGPFPAFSHFLREKALGMRLFNTLNARIEYKYNDIILMLVTGDLKQDYSAIIV